MSEETVADAQKEAQKAKAKQQQLESERKIKEEQLRIQQIDRKLQKAYDADLTDDDAEAVGAFLSAFNATPTEVNNILSALSPESIQTLRQIISKNPGGAAGYAYLAQVQQQQGRGFDIEQMLKFMQMVEHLANRNGQSVPVPVQPMQAAPAPSTSSSDIVKLMTLFINQQEKQAVQNLELQREMLSNKQQQQLDTLQTELKELKDMIRQPAQQPSMREWMLELGEQIEFLDKLRPRNENPEITKARLDLELALRKMDHEAKKEENEISRGIELINTAKETLQEFMAGIVEPGVQAHIDEVRARVHAEKAKQDNETLRVLKESGRLGEIFPTRQGSPAVIQPNPEAKQAPAPAGQELSATLTPMPEPARKKSDLLDLS